MFAICPPLFRATRSTLPFSGGLITLSASLCCSGPSASLHYQPCSNLCCQHKLLSLTATNAPNPKGIAGVRSSTIWYMCVASMLMYMAYVLICISKVILAIIWFCMYIQKSPHVNSLFFGHKVHKRFLWSGGKCPPNSGRSGVISTYIEQRARH